MPAAGVPLVAVRFTPAPRAFSFSLSVGAVAVPGGGSTGAARLGAAGIVAAAPPGAAVPAACSAAAKVRQGGADGRLDGLWMCL